MIIDIDTLLENEEHMKFLNDLVQETMVKNGIADKVQLGILEEDDCEYSFYLAYADEKLQKVSIEETYPQVVAELRRDLDLILESSPSQVMH